MEDQAAAKNNKEGEDKIEYEILPDDYPKYDLSFKIIVIGDSGVGKSCLSVKATKNLFENNYLATVGFEFFNFFIRMEGIVIKLQIWDTCGQEIYRSLITNFYRNSSLAVIVYSIDDMKSFKDIEMWLKELKQNSSPDVKVFIIGNKNDLADKRQVKYDEAEKFKNDYELNLFMETSALTGFNAKEIFIEAAKLLYEEFKQFRKKDEEKKIKLSDLSEHNSETEKTQENKKGCCK